MKRQKIKVFVAIVLLAICVGSIDGFSEKVVPNTCVGSMFIFEKWSCFYQGQIHTYFQYSFEQCCVKSTDMNACNSDAFSSSCPNPFGTALN